MILTKWRTPIPVAAIATPVPVPRPPAAAVTSSAGPTDAAVPNSPLRLPVPLSQLDARLMRIELQRRLINRLKPGIDPLRGHWTDDDFEAVMADVEVRIPCDFAQAQEVSFLCPAHIHQDGHSTRWSFADRGVPAGQGTRNQAGQDVRWQVSGSGLHDLTLSPSLLVQAEPWCSWHGYVHNGMVKNA